MSFRNEYVVEHAVSLDAPDRAPLFRDSRTEPYARTEQETEQREWQKEQRKILDRRAILTDHEERRHNTEILTDGESGDEEDIAWRERRNAAASAAFLAPHVNHGWYELQEAKKRYGKHAHAHTVAREHKYELSHAHTVPREHKYELSHAHKVPREHKYELSPCDRKVPYNKGQTEEERRLTEELHNHPNAFASRVPLRSRAAPLPSFGNMYIVD